MLKVAQRILIPIDLNYPTNAKILLDTAFALGGDEAEYFVLSVVPPVGGGIVSSYLPKNYDEKIKQGVFEALGEFLSQHYPERCENLHHLVRHGTIYEEIHDVALDKQADLIVVKATKPNGKGLGPNAARVARNSRTSVLIVR